jgi:crotonobetainyl-CoA:carnitine CoA-transferase CaiB-like acyl-CoA transferase
VAISRALTTSACAVMASHFVWTNRSKESLTLDVKHAEAPGILAGLLDRADVLVQNLAPGAAARLGLSYAALNAKHPRLIVCDISGYGSDGPYRDRKAYDLLIQSESGFLSVTGESRRASQGRLLDCRHRGRHVRLQPHPGRAAAARQERLWLPHRGVDA